MYFKELELNNYSLFGRLQIAFQISGIHVISGPNASGKTQLAGSFLIPLFSKHAVSKNPYADEKDAEIHLSICGENNQQDIKCTLRTKGGSIEYKREINETNSTGIDLRNKLILPLQEGRSPSIIFTHRIPNKELSDKDIDVINDAFKASPFTSRYDASYKYIVDTYCNHKLSSFSTASQGQQHFFSWLREFSYRQLSTEQFPLIVDDELSLYDHYHRHLICLLLSVISEKSQVILFTSDSAWIVDIPDKSLALNLSIDSDIKSRSTSCFGYKYGFLENILQNKFNKTKITYEHNKYYINEIYRHEENRYYEFKEVKGNNPVNSIISISDIYVVSFLNSRLNNDGKIIWGITDGDNKIVGVRLNRQQRDDIRKGVSEKFAQIEPPVVMSIFKIELHKIYDKNKFPIDDLYLVEITIPMNSTKYLYSTSNKEVYIKTDGGKRKLTPFQLQQEILHRHGIADI